MEAPSKKAITSGRVTCLARRANDYSVRIRSIGIGIAKASDRKRRAVEWRNLGSISGLNKADKEVFTVEGSSLP